MYSTKQYLIGFLLLFMTVFSSWLVLKSPGNSVNPTSLANSPDSFMRNIVAINMNNDTGLPENQLQAPFAMHYTTNNTTEITQPHFLMFHVGEQPWSLSAKYGRAIDGVDEVKLWDNVILNKSASANNQALLITTSAVTIYPKKQYAETDQPVVGTQPGAILKAIGMSSYFKTGIIELHSHVQGAYQK